MKAPRRRIPRECEQCHGTYQCRVDQLSQRFCSRRCKADWMKAQPRQWTEGETRRLRDDEPIPTGEPGRYRLSTGYIVLRWKVGVRSYVELLEHRYVTGRVSQEVHHINGVKDDNRPENLKPVTTLEHGAEHAKWDIDEACERYRQGWSLCDIQRHYRVGTVQAMRALELRGVAMRTLQQAAAIRNARRAA